MEMTPGKVVYIPKGRNPGKKPEIEKEILDRLNEKGEPLSTSELREIAEKYEVSLRWVRKLHQNYTMPAGKKPTQAQVEAITRLVESLGGDPQSVEDVLTQMSLTRKQVKTLQFFLHTLKSLRKAGEKSFIRLFCRRVGIRTP